MKQRCRDQGTPCDKVLASFSHDILVPLGLDINKLGRLYFEKLRGMSESRQSQVSVQYESGQQRVALTRKNTDGLA